MIPGNKLQFATDPGLRSARPDHRVRSLRSGSLGLVVYLNLGSGRLQRYNLHGALNEGRLDFVPAAYEACLLRNSLTGPNLPVL